MMTQELLLCWNLDRNFPKHIWFMLWLVIKGAKPQPLDATASSSAGG